MNLRVNTSLTESTDFSAGSNKFLEKKIRFSFKFAQSERRRCIKDFDKRELLGLYKTLGEKESLTWSQFMGLPRNNGGISIEKKDSSNHSLLSGINSTFSTFGHMRIKNTPNGRIFGAIHEDLFYIILFDRTGAINH